MINDLLTSFITFFTAIDPIGTIPVFIAVTASAKAQKRKKIANKAALVAAGVLLFFIIVGELILNAIDIPLPAFQMAGGIILFLFALTMIFGESKPDQEVKLVENHHETAVFPLAVPSIAGPGVILTAVLLTENSRFSVWEQAQVTSMMLVVLFVTYLLMRSAGQINRLIGAGGAGLVSRVMGLILASVAMSNTLEGIKLYFEL